MAMVKQNFSANQTNTVLVAAVPSRIILVTRILASFDSAGTLKLVVDPEGTPADLLPSMYVAGKGLLDLRLGLSDGLGVESGKALGLTTALSIALGHTVMVWYELVT